MARAYDVRCSNASVFTEAFFLNLVHSAYRECRPRTARLVTILISAAVRFHFPAAAITGSELTSTSPPGVVPLSCDAVAFVSKRTLTNGNTTITEARLLLRMGNRRRCLGHVHVEPGRVHLGVHSVRQAAGGGIRREPYEHHRCVGVVADLGPAAGPVVREVV